MSVKMRSIIKNTRGESLLEGIVSILIFTVLIATVTVMISTSLRITSGSLQRATEWQANVNTVNEDAVEGSGGDDETITLEITINNGSVAIEVSIDVDITIHEQEDGGFFAFAPE
jgi:lipopolysaccharide export LptBFGC system permease protein LptF